MVGARRRHPRPGREGRHVEGEVAEVIYTAATDDTTQLRYISGHGAQELLPNRYSAEQDEQFVAGMRAQFGL